MGMHTAAFSVADFLDRARAAAGNCSDYRLAKLIGVTQSAMSGYRTGHRTPDERAVLALCKLTGDDPDEIAAEIQALRAPTPEAAALWRRVAERLHAAGAATLSGIAFLLATLGAVSVDQASAAPLLSDDVAGGLRIMSSVVLARLAWRLWRLTQRKRTQGEPPTIAAL